ncbi:hypothetical protein DFH27DRAFT_547085, partial [Peziza echinospora]
MRWDGRVHPFYTYIHTYTHTHIIALISNSLFFSNLFIMIIMPFALINTISLVPCAMYVPCLLSSLVTVSRACLTSYKFQLLEERHDHDQGGGCKRI